MGIKEITKEVANGTINEEYGSRIKEKIKELKGVAGKCHDTLNEIQASNNRVKEELLKTIGAISALDDILKNENLQNS
jgi:cell division protein ZapA (FtsZ GTPase activity inhibitor)